MHSKAFITKLIVRDVRQFVLIHGARGVAELRLRAALCVQQEPAAGGGVRGYCVR